MQPSSLYTPTISRKPSKPRIYQEDQLDSFLTTDEIKSFDCLNEKHAPPGYSFHKTEQHILYYLLQFDDETAFPIVREAIKVDNNLHVQLQYCNNPVPLPQWFSQGRNAKLTNFSILENFPQYLRNFANEQKSLIAELQKRQYHRSKGQPPYSSEMIRFALLLRYTSFQAYKILLQNFPLPSLSLLAKLKSGNVNATKDAELLRQKNAISDDVILIADEMYLQKKVQYVGGKNVGADLDGNLFRGIVVFMIHRAKEI